MITLMCLLRSLEAVEEKFTVTLNTERIYNFSKKLCEHRFENKEYQLA